MTTSSWWEIGGVAYTVVLVLVLRALAHTFDGESDSGHHRHGV